MPNQPNRAADAPEPGVSQGTFPAQPAGAAGAAGVAGGRAGESSAAGGDGALSIIADLEKQFERLRSAQKSQDDAINLLRTRTEALQRAESELEQTRAQLARQEQEMEAQRQQIAQQKQQLEANMLHADERLREKLHAVTLQTQELETQKQSFALQSEQVTKRQQELEQVRSQLDAARKSMDELHKQRALELEAKSLDLTNRQQAFELEQQRVAELEQQCQKQRAAFDQQGKALAQERAEMSQRVEQAERNVGELMTQLEKSSEALAAKTKEWEAAATELKAQRQSARELEKAVQAATQRIAGLEDDAAELAKRSEQERIALEKKIEKGAAQLQKMTEARDAALAELDSLRKEHAAASKQLDGAIKELGAAHKSIQTLEGQVQSLQEQLAKSQKETAGLREKLEQATAQVKEFAQTISDQRPQLERGAAAIEMVSKLNDQVTQLSADLAETRLKSDPEEVERRDKRIAELTEALRQARGQSTGEGGAMADLQLRNAELAAEADKLRLQAHNAQIASEQIKRQLQEQTQRIAAAGTQDAAAAELATKLAAVTAQLEQAKESAAADLKKQLGAQAERFAKEHAKPVSGGAAASELKQLREQVASLKQELVQARAAGATGGGSAQQADEAAANLREKAERITVVAEHLRRRRNRLEKMRRLVKKSQPKAAVSSDQQIRVEESMKLEAERLKIVDLKRALSTAEKEMQRRWARPKSAIAVGSLFFVIVVCAIASWLAADHYFPQQVSASVVLEARNRTSTPLNAEEAQGWREWHRDMLHDSGFQQILAKRFAERRLERFAGMANLTEQLKTNLTIDAAQDGVMVLTIAGTDPDELTSVLDVIATSLSMESHRLVDRRLDNAPAVAIGERTTEGLARYASVNPTSLLDERLVHGLPIFGGLVLVSLALLFLTYTKLASAKRVFDKETAGLFEEPAATR